MLTKTEGMDLQPGYELEELGQNLLLKRPNGYVLAAFGERVKPENIGRVAEADEKFSKQFQKGSTRKPCSCSARMSRKPARSFS